MSRPRTALRLPCALLLPIASLAACGNGDEPADTGTVTEVVSEDPARPVIAPTFEEARERGAARIGYFYVPSGGFAYHDDDGRLTGVTVELLRDFAAHVSGRHGIDLEVAWIEEELWADFYEYVRRSEGGVFGIGNVTITEERRDELAFSPPYLDNVAALVTHERVPELDSMDRIGEAFAGMTALSYPGTLHERRIETIRREQLPDAPVREVTSNDELVSRLASDEEYFAYIDVYNFWRAREAGQRLRRHDVGDDASETFGVIMPRGSDWAPVMEEFFEADGGYVRGERFQGHLRAHLGEALASLLTTE